MPACWKAEVGQALPLRSCRPQLRVKPLLASNRCTAPNASPTSTATLSQAVSIVAWSPDATYLATGDASGQLLVWSLRAGGVVRSMQVRAARRLPCQLRRGAWLAGCWSFAQLYC